MANTQSRKLEKEPGTDSSLNRNDNLADLEENTKEQQNLENDENTNYLNYNVISYEDMTYSLRKNPKEIVKTELLKKFVEKFLENLTRNNIDAICLSGKSGIGKTTIVEEVVNLINEGNCPDLFKNTGVIKIFPEAFTYQAMEIEISTTLISILDKFSEKYEKIIVFFENIEYFPESLIICFKRIMNFVNTNINFKFIKVILEGDFCFLEKPDNFQYIGIIRNSVSFRIDSNYKYSEVSKVIYPRVKELSEKYSIKISKKILNYFVYYRIGKTNLDIIDLKLIINSVDLLFATCKNKKEITMSDIKKVFESDFEKYNKIKKKNRLSTAYHEAGHALFAILNKNFIELRLVNGITDSSTNYMGITDADIKVPQSCQTKKDTIKYIAFYLAGREAESLVSKNKNLGATADLYNACQVAKKFILSSGLYKNIGKNCYYTFEDLMTGQKLNAYDKELQKLIKSSQKYAKKQIKKHRNFIDILAKKIFKKGLLTDKEVYKIWKKYKISN